MIDMEVNIKNIILSKCKFDVSNHMGPMKPEYYQYGCPCSWKCLHCLKTI